MNKLSVVIITFNEESEIGRCIDSVAGLADEVIVMDSFSTDLTESICRQKGADFYQHTFDDYSSQKNRAMALANNDLVLSLDADEALDSTLKKAIMLVKQHAACDGYTMNRLTNYCGKWIRHGAWYPDRKLRLFNRQKAQWEGSHIHESCEMLPGCSTGHLQGDILHYSYTSVESHVAQFNRFTSLSATEMYKNGQRSSLFQIYLSPLSNFVKGFFIKLGFLDGYFGTLICVFNAFATYVKYLKLRQLNKGLKI